MEDARTARLSAKLLALANSGKEPIRGPGDMEVEVETKGILEVFDAENSWALTD